MSKRLATQPLTRSDEITVMVFKDNDTSRSFQVSLGWITRLGFALGALVVATLICGFFALKYYRVAHKADPSHIEGLERQLSDLASANKGLESKLASATQSKPQGSAEPAPVPTVTVTVAAPAPAPGSILLFSALPKQTQDLTNSASSLPITVSTARTSWTKGGHNLAVTFNIQYTGTDRGSQQGRIIVLARGTSAMMTYPQGILSRAGADSLIVPPQGEYFSVSRFREVKAEFSEARGLQDVEIMITSLEGQLLFYQKVTASEPPAAPVHAPKPAAPPKVTVPSSEATPGATTTSAPSSTSSDLIEPGTDQ